MKTKEYKLWLDIQMKDPLYTEPLNGLETVVRVEPTIDSMRGTNVVIELPKRFNSKVKANGELITFRKKYDV